jgi:Tfp pilus assembly protein PilP
MRRLKLSLHRRRSLFLITLLVITGCSRGALTTREKAQELELWVAQVLGRLLGLQLAALVPELPLAESWG